MSFPRYPKYKDSGVKWLGEVPEHWDVKRFKRIFKEREERSLNGEGLLLSVSAYTGISPRSEVIDAGDHLSRAESLEGYKVCYNDDLVMNIMLAWNRGLAFTTYSGIVSPAYCVFYLIDDSEPKFLNYLIRSDRYTLYFKAFSAGVIDSRLRIYPETFGRLFCSLPPHAEQTRIAAFLDRETAKIDDLVAEQRRLMELLKEKRQAVISHAVTQGLNPDAPMKPSGIEWLGDVPAHWDATPIKYVAKVGNGSTPSREVPEYWGETGFPWLNSSVVNASVVTEAEGFVTERALRECHLPIVAPPAILVGITGQGRTRGMAAMLGIEATINQHVAYVRPNSTKLDVRYLLRILESAYLKLRRDSEEAGATKGAITCGQIGNLRIPLPSLAEQRAISAFLDIETAKFDTLTAEAQHAIDLLQERRTALISAAVTGQIDVRELNERKAA
ncbi:MAG: restriction endonuclease subunit S [Betaproteobacteria bacterium]|nr:restriction endonuclease subunit S [Betaproteobacteria bacterium]